MCFNGIEPDWDVIGLDQEGIEEYKYWSEALKNAAGIGIPKYPELDEAVNNNLTDVAMGLKAPVEAMEAIQSVSETIERTY